MGMLRGGLATYITPVLVGLACTTQYESVREGMRVTILKGNVDFEAEGSCYLPQIRGYVGNGVTLPCRVPFSLDQLLNEAV